MALPSLGSFYVNIQIIKTQGCFGTPEKKIYNHGNILYRTPDFRKNTKRYMETEVISFLNVPLEADEEAMTQFVQQYATVLGKPRYPVERIDEIEYLTGTRIYHVHSRKKRIPRQITLFGRQIRCIYTNQPDQKAWLEKKKQQNREVYNSDDEINQEQQTYSDQTNTDESDNEQEQNKHKKDLQK